MVSAEFQMNLSFKKLQLLAGKEIRITKKDKTLSLDVPGITYAVYKVK
jgi:hypothetical protein